MLSKSEIGPAGVSKKKKIRPPHLSSAAGSAGHAREKALVVTYNHGLNDPPIKQAAESLAAEAYQVTLLQSPVRRAFPTEAPKGVSVVEYWMPRRGGGLNSLVRWLSFWLSVKRALKDLKPDVVVAFMPPSLAAMPGFLKRGNVVACIYDVPALNTMGRLDRWIFTRGFRFLKNAGVTWCSDYFRAVLTKDLADLKTLPLVCHNCPPKDYFHALPAARDPWLRRELIKLGAPLNPKGGGCILLRAGAIGESCGLDETLEAMSGLPKDYVFLMMGRPDPGFLEALKARIKGMGLQNRAFVWNLPSDEVWKKALIGADIGHVIHGPFQSAALQEQFKLNSSLSNNRIFQYMAAGLPVLAYDDPRMSGLYKEVGCFRSARILNLREDLEAHWRELGASAALRRRLGLRARRAHLKKYCWEYQFAPVLQAVHGRAVEPA